VGKASFATSHLALAQRAPFCRGITGKTIVWLKLTEPGGKLIHINVQHVTSVRSDTQIPGARAQLDLTSGKFQGVQENVEQVMQLISAAQALARMTKHQAQPFEQAAYEIRLGELQDTPSAIFLCVVL
jgi:hypothetical protein